MYLQKISARNIILNGKKCWNVLSEVSNGIRTLLLQLNIQRNFQQKTSHKPTLEKQDSISSPQVSYSSKEKKWCSTYLVFANLTSDDSHSNSGWRGWRSRVNLWGKRNQDQRTSFPSNNVLAPLKKVTENYQKA